jgi:hypothetical protein
MDCAADVEATFLFRRLAGAHPGVEVWPDEEYTEGGWSYASIVSRFDGNVRILAYVRLRPGQLQRRTYDKAGDDLWVAAE